MPVRVVVVEPEEAGNVGFIARLVENFAVDEYVLVAPQCDPLSEAARRHASNAEQTLLQARTVPDIDAAVDGCDVVAGTTGITASADNVRRAAATPDQFAADMPADETAAIVLGREGTGLTNAELDRCDCVVSIPAADDYPVLNLSHAAAVLLHAVYRADRVDETAADGEQRAALEHLFKGAVDSLEWEESRQEKAVRAFRNVLGRAHLTAVECRLLLGALRDLADAVDNH